MESLALLSLSHRNLVLLGAGVGVSLITTPLFRWVALRLGIVDRPGPRKIHSRPMAYLGGLSFFFSLLAVILIALFYFPQYLEEWQRKFTGSDPSAHPIVPLVTGALLVILLGLYDDIRGASARIKLPCQILIGIYMYRAGFSIGQLSNPFDFAGGTLDLSSMAVVLTVLWYVGLMNAVNLIDGMDGLAAGVVAIASGSLFFIALSDQNYPAMLMAIVILGGTLGFLPYNFPPAKLFMGDTGSLLLGFLLASAGVMGEVKGNTLVATVIPMIALGVSLLDTTMAFVRRILHGQHPFRADQQHIHHRLLRLGLTQRQVVLIIYYCSVLFGLTSYLLSRIETRYSFLTVIILGLSLLLGIRVLHFVENLTRRKNAAIEAGNGGPAAKEPKITGSQV